jgi:hypothetical protein
MSSNYIMNNIKMNLKEIGFEDLESIHLAQDKVQQ